MTALSHLDPAFSSVFAIEAVNEPILDGNKTPGYNYFVVQINFVKVVRVVEAVLGIAGARDYFPTLLNSLSTTNFTAALQEACSSSTCGTEVVQALSEAIPILLNISSEYGLEDVFTSKPFYSQRSPLVTNFMNVNWQNNNSSNPADAAMGPQAYDDHLYYKFGGVADADPTAYMESICNLNRVQNDTALGNSPLWFGEWSLATQFDASDAFLCQWGDAQKRAYSQGAGWIYWNFKFEISTLTNGTAWARQWSYLEALNLDLLTEDPSSYYDPNPNFAFRSNRKSSVEASVCPTSRAVITRTSHTARVVFMM
ncbi:hypothetical protein ID866_8826 [Astraeus odoratus]|nr:hypothetical protein ID866_8826 [Astraeus odoratus]